MSDKDYEYLYKKYKTKYIDLKNLLQKGGKDFNFGIKEPWFTSIQRGDKTVEGRLARGIFTNLKPGDIIYWNNANRKIKTVVDYIEKYDPITFKDPLRSYLQTEGLEKTLPGIPTIQQGIDLYHQYYTDQDIKKYGIVAIHLKLLD